MNAEQIHSRIEQLKCLMLKYKGAAETLVAALKLNHQAYSKDAATER